MKIKSRIIPAKPRSEELLYRYRYVGSSASIGGGGESSPGINAPTYWELITEDSEGNPLEEPYILTEYSAVSAKELSAYGARAGLEEGNTGASYERLDDWFTYDAEKAGWVLSAKLGKDLLDKHGSLSTELSDKYNELRDKDTDLENKLDGIATGATNLSLGTSSTTAYRGDYGNTAYNHSQATGNPHGVTASLVGAYTKSETNVEIDKAKSTNHGYRYYYSFTMYGDHDKYYPFMIAGGDQNMKRDILVKRSYSEKHPPEWYSSTHGGGLTLKLKANFGGWGGANYGWEIHELEEMYNPTFGGCYHTTSYMTFSIMLRGGGTGGAIYHVYSDQPIERSNHPVHVSGTSPQSANYPLIFYTPTTLKYGTSASTWTSSTPLTTPNAEDIRIRNFIALSKQMDILLGKTSGTSSLNITGNASSATKLQNARTIGGVSFNGTANINLPGVNTAGNQNTTGSAATLTTARNINGTSFNGSASITTANWGTARNIGVVNSDGTGTAVTTSVNGSANVNLKLPATIKASLTGNASTATTAANLDRSILAGNGLTGGGTLSANRTITLGTPSTLTATSTNTVGTTNHSHAITTTSVGAANTIVQTDASGGVRGNIIRIGGAWTLELSGTELVFKYNGVTKQRFLSDGSIVAVGEVTAITE